MNKKIIEEILKEQKLTKMKVAMLAGIPPSDFYQALNGKKPFFPKWRKQLANALCVPEEKLFPEAENNNEI